MTETLEGDVSDESSRSKGDTSGHADSLYAEYLALREAGEGVEFREWIRRYPSEARDLEELHAGWSHFESNFDAVLERRSPPGGGESGAEPVRVPSGAPLRPGQEVGDYRLERPMGSGGMGQVWSAFQLSLRRRVALKFIRPEKTSKAYVELFAREARAAGRIAHPGIVTVHGHGHADGLHWIAMELVEGERTLADDLADARARPSLPGSYYRDVAERFLLIVRALGAAHRAGIVHRDVKPRNILITAEGLPKVTDFGLARIEDESRLQESMAVVGSAYYMSPEQALGKSARVGSRSDVFSLGVVFYEALTLNKAFEGDTVLDVLRRIVRVDPPEPHVVSRRVPAELSTICVRAMEKRRRDRFQTMEDFAASLEAWLANRPLPISPPGPVMRLRKWSLRHPTAASVTALLGASLTVITGLWLATLRAENEARERARFNEMLVQEMRAEQLVRDARWLGPVRPDNALGFERWIEEVRALAARREAFEREFAALRAGGTRRVEPTGDAELIEIGEQVAEAEGLLRQLEQQRTEIAAFLAGEPLPEGYSTRAERTLTRDALASLERRRAREQARIELLRSQQRTRGQWTFEEGEDQRRHDHLARVLSALDELCHPGVGWLPRIERRHADALSLTQRTIEEPALAWERVAREVATDHGLEGLPPQLGLVPLGRDPFSGLQEFWHVLSGARPARDAEGLLELRADSGLVLVLVPGGSSLLGAEGRIGEPSHDPWKSPNDPPLREVEVEPFFVSKYELTQGQWLRLTGSNPSRWDAGRSWQFHGFIDERHPVERVSWLDCRQALADVGLDLPTEDQWEHAARGGTYGLYWTGDDFDVASGVANFGDRAFAESRAGIQHESGHDDGFVLHAPVDSFEPNPLGLYCVTGNVDEWCLDAFVDIQPSFKIVRGGNYSHARNELCVARRRVWPADRRWDNLGVRPVRPISW